jgi:hypothetical protein
VIVAVVFGIWLFVVALAVAIDAGSGYLADRPEKEEKTDPETFTEDDPEVKKGIAAYRNFKMIELGLIKLDQREVRVDRPRGSHRKVQVS